MTPEQTSFKFDLLRHNRISDRFVIFYELNYVLKHLKPN
jgi:hypothetical protein